MRNFSVIMLMFLALAGCGDKKTTTSAEPAASLRSKMQAAALKNQAYIDQGMKYLQSSNIPAAIKSFNAAIKQNPRDPRGYLVLGQTYMRMQEYDKAINSFSVAAKVAPEDGEAYYLLAVNYGLTGDKVLARQNAEKSIEIFKNQRNQEKFVRSVALLNGLTKPEEK